MMFGKHGIFGIGSSWKKVVRQESSRRKVVLTKVTLLRKDSQCEDILSHPALAKTGNPEDNPREQASNHTELSKSGVQSPLLLVKRPSNCTLLTLYKSESEDSGVELPSGTNSPSTPSGSEQSFVVHRRESSCDSGMAMSIISSSPAIQHSPFPGHCPNSERCIKEDQKAEKQCSEEHPQTTEQVKKLPTASEDWRKIKRSNTRFSQRPTIVDEGVNGPRHVSLVEIVIADTNSPPVSNDVMKHEVYRGAAEARLDQESLKRQPSSDSLDKYMEKCCRLSEVNQENLADQGSGLGYLEHVCQLIETIGQLHEQNKRLQRQVWGVERALSVNRMKEDFFLNHCSCGAVGIFESLTSLPDLQPGSSNVPMEQGSWSRARSPAQHTGCTGTQGDDGDRGGRGRCAKPICRKVASLEVELKYGRDRTRNLNLLHQGHQECLENPPPALFKGTMQDLQAEAQTCGKFRVLVRKSGLKNQDTLQESSNMLKRSYPRLDRSEGGTCHSLMKDTNSTSALGLTRKSDWGNSH